MLTLEEAGQQIDEMRQAINEVAEGLVALSGHILVNTEAIAKLVEIANKQQSKIVRL